MRIMLSDLDNVLGRSVLTERAWEYATGASLLVDEELAGAGLSAGRLRQIELYLSAHFATMASERAANLSSETIDDLGSRVYAGTTGAMLSATRYGQQAMTLDTSNNLRRLGSEKMPALFRMA